MRNVRSYNSPLTLKNYIAYFSEIVKTLDIFNKKLKRSIFVQHFGYTNSEEGCGVGVGGVGGGVGCGDGGGGGGGEFESASE